MLDNSNILVVGDGMLCIGKELCDIEALRMRFGPLLDKRDICHRLFERNLIIDGVKLLDVCLLRYFPCRVLFLNAFHVAAEEVESLEMQLFRLLFEG